MKLYSVYLPQELKRGLAALKTRDGISESEAVRRALAEFLKRRRIPIVTPRGGTKPKRK